MNIRRIPINGYDVFTIDSFADINSVSQMHSAIVSANFTVLGCSKEETTKTREVMFDLEVDDFNKHWLGHRINKLIYNCYGLNLECYKVLGNCVRFGSNTFIHQDSDNENIVSALYFVNSNWSADWGGELCFFDNAKDGVCCVSMKPGRLILFPSNIYHRAGVPLRPCVESRFTISARYKPFNLKEKNNIV